MKQKDIREFLEETGETPSKPCISEPKYSPTLIREVFSDSMKWDKTHGSRINPLLEGEKIAGSKVGFHSALDEGQIRKKRYSSKFF